MNSEINILGSINNLNTRASFGRISAGNARATSEIIPVNSVDFNSPNLQYTDPSKHGAISQLINNQYIDAVKKETKRVLVGRKLEEFLKSAFSVGEFQKLPKPAQNLLMFHKEMKTADVVRFIEFQDSSHEIVFRELGFEQAKFKALFEALGQLYDVQMEAGCNNFFSLSKNFEIRKKVETIFSKIEEKIVFLTKKRKKRRQSARISSKQENSDSKGNNSRGNSERRKRKPKSV